MINENIFERVKQFIIKKSCIRGESMTRETRIEEDLGITGTDALELIIAFAKEFKVDVSKFMAAEYFEPEGMNLLMPHTVPNKKILILGDLEKAAIAGKLDETIIGHK